MRQDQDLNGATHLHGDDHDIDSGHSRFLEGLIQTLLSEADTPPKEVNGVSDEFLAGMESSASQDYTALISNQRCNYRIRACPEESLEEGYVLPYMQQPIP